VSVARSGRFAGERDSAFVRLNSSLALDWRLWREDVEASKAHAAALARCNVLTEGELAAILDGLTAVAREIEGGVFAPRDEDEDVHMAVERRLTELIGEAGAKLHTARSRNDQVVTDVRLHLRRVIERQDAALYELQALLVERAGEHVRDVLPAYTHLQRAQVTSLAHHLLAYFWMLARDRDRFARARAACLELPLGAGAAVGVNYDLDRGAVARELGFDRVSPNSLDAVADRDFVLDYLYAAAVLGAHLGRLGAELVLWSTAEFSFVRLPEALSGGSSIMPQKRNPDAAELMRAAAPRLASNLHGLLGVLHGLPLAYNTDLREDKRYLFDAVDCLDELLPVVAGLLAGAEFDTARMAAACDSFLLATDVADYLVGNGMPFREAHHLVGVLVRLCLERGVGLFELPAGELAALLPALNQGFSGLADVQASLAAKRSLGGSAPERIGQQLAGARALLAARKPAGQDSAAWQPSAVRAPADGQSVIGTEPPTAG
jgi:argininosuccinate lyase